MERRVGVLALQGDFEPHAAMLRRLGVVPALVRRHEQLDELTHLVLPGGESTTLHHLLVLFGLWDAIRERSLARSLALFGTCAGAILLGRDDGAKPPRMGLLDASVERNAYGPQIESRTTSTADHELGAAPLECTFIRAPRITRVGAGVRVLARCGDDPILVESPGLLAATFHPELGLDARVHRRFLGLHPSARADHLTTAASQPS